MVIPVLVKKLLSVFHKPDDQGIYWTRRWAEGGNNCPDWGVGTQPVGLDSRIHKGLVVVGLGGRCMGIMGSMGTARHWGFGRAVRVGKWRLESIATNAIEVKGD
jgi:hypothetical protein